MSSVTFVPTSFGPVSLTRASISLSTPWTGKTCRNTRPAFSTRSINSRVTTTAKVNFNPEFEDKRLILPSEMKEELEVLGGFNDYGELLNGRAAMVGFIIALGIELVTGRGLISIVNDLLG